jgi:hypothetical protein
MAKTYMMENDTLMSVVIDDSTDPKTMTFFLPDGRECPKDWPAPFGAEWWSWRRITEDDWKSIPEQERQLRISAAKAPVSETDDEPDES